MRIYFAADHAGFDLKARLMAFVSERSTPASPFDVQDCGAFAYDAADDYPDIIGRAGAALAADAAQGVESRAIVLGASGQGEAMAMNRFKGVRCALYYGEPGRAQTDASGKQLDMLSSTREHNDANALSLGARFLSEDEAKGALSRWLGQSFGGEGRHIRRIGKLDTLRDR
jgi:ribose 5-phosphate isomerase B